MRMNHQQEADYYKGDRDGRRDAARRYGEASTQGKTEHYVMGYRDGYAAGRCNQGLTMGEQSPIISLSARGHTMNAPLGIMASYLRGIKQGQDDASLGIERNANFFSGLCPYFIDGYQKGYAGGR